MVQEETEQLNAIRSYKDVVEWIENRKTYQPMEFNKYRIDDSKVKESKLMDLICWTCNRKGHMSPIWLQKRKKKCYKFEPEDHLRRDYNKVKCFNCNRLEHTAMEWREKR